MKKHYNLWLSPLLVLGIFTLIYVIFAKFPFGNAYVTFGDMNQQSLPLLMQFRDMVLENGNLFLNLKSAGGINFWGVFFFFIGSPFSLLALIVPKAYLPALITVLVPVKISLCAFSASLFFKTQFKSLSKGFNVLLSLSYAFSGFGLMYFQNFSWPDVMIIFPLLLIAFVRMVEGKKPFWYIVTLTGFVFVNYYLTYMLAAFLILAMGVYILFVCKKADRGSAALRFIISSAISLLLSAVVWLPSFCQYLNSARTEGTGAPLLSTVFFTHIPTTLPIIITSAIILATLPFLRQLKGNKSVKAVCILAILLIIPLFIKPINKMWHIGSYQAFPARYGYITLMLCLILSAFVLSRVKKNEVTKTSPAYVILSVILAIVYIALTVTFILAFPDVLSRYVSYFWSYWPSLLLQLTVFILGAAVLGTFLFLYRKKLLTKRFLTLMMGVIICAEGFFNATVYVGTVSNDMTNFSYVVDLEDKIEDDSFWRVNTAEKNFDVNLLGGIGYNNIAHYTSLTRESYLFGLKELGYSSYWMEMSSSGGTEFTDALLANKYLISFTDYLTDKNKAIYSNERYAITQNELVTSSGIVVDDYDESLSGGTRFNTQQAMFESVCDTDDSLFEEYDCNALVNVAYSKKNGGYSLKLLRGVSKGTMTYGIQVTGEQTLYFDCFDKLTNAVREEIYGSFNITVNGKEIASGYPRQRQSGLLKLGDFCDEAVIVTVEVLKDVDCTSFGVYGLESEVLRKNISNLHQADVMAKAGTITVNCTAEKGEYLILMLPYDEGYTALVNGKKSDINTAYDTFMAIPLNEGDNEIVLSFMPKGLKTGIILSLIGLLALMLYMIIKPKGKIYALCERLADKLFIAAAVIVLFALYIFPLIMWAVAIL